MGDYIHVTPGFLKELENQSPSSYGYTGKDTKTKFNSFSNYLINGMIKQP